MALARLRAESAGRVAVLLVDLTQFSVLQASVGPHCCDDLLGQVSERLRLAAPSDFAAHFGGECFALVNDTLRCDAAGISLLAETVLREAGGTYDLGGGHVVSLALRIGIAGIARSEGVTLDGRTLLNQAEIALAGATESDSTHYHFYSTALAEASRERQSLVRDLKQAIEAGYRSRRSLPGVSAQNGIDA